MKLSVKNLAIVTIVGLGLMLPAIALAVPAIPHQFYGTVNFTNGPAPDGLLVEAKVINGVNILSTESTITKNGKYGYDPLFKVEDENSTLSGKTIEFYVSGIKANQTATFANGESTNLNLTIPASLPTTPTPSPTPTGGGGYIPVSTIKGDINGDNKVDKYDFSLMMANWGKTETNSSDLNNDGKVDKYDFALLMLNWSI